MKHSDFRSLIGLALIWLVVALAQFALPIPSAAHPPMGMNLDDGSASAPAYSFTSDPDTGVYRVGANDVGLATNGAKIFDCSATGCANAGTFVSSGATTINSNAQITGTITGGATGNAVFYQSTEVAVAALTGTVVITVPATNQFQLVNVEAIAKGGACATVTTVDVIDAISPTVKLVTYAQANLTQSTVLRPGSTGVTVLADGASYNPLPLGHSVSVSITGSTPTTCTYVRFNLAYVLK